LTRATPRRTGSYPRPTDSYIGRKWRWLGWAWYKGMAVPEGLLRSALDASSLEMDFAVGGRRFELSEDAWSALDSWWVESSAGESGTSPDWRMGKWKQEFPEAVGAL
jgi:hypothetical protein